MFLFRAMAPGKTYWSTTLDDSMATAQQWAVAMSRQQLTGEVEVAHLFFGMRSPEKLAEAFNGFKPMKRRWYVRFDKGVPVEEYRDLKRNVRAKVLPVYTTVHPSERHADWVKTMMRDISGYQDVFARAPDPKSALLALRIANADRSSGGYKLTLNIAEYLWQWANCSLHKRKRVR